MSATAAQHSLSWLIQISAELEIGKRQKMDGWVDAEMDGHWRRQMQKKAHRYFSLSWKQLKPYLNTLEGTRLGSDLYFLLLQFT